MVSTTHMKPVANTFLLLTNILNSVKIEKLSVPELVASDCVDAVLDCRYSAVGDDVTVLWLYNGIQVYEWKQGTEPVVSGVLDGKLDLTYRLSSWDGRTVEKRALRIVVLTPELSGQYTCVVRSHAREARATSPMTVYSPERDFMLTFSETEHNSSVLDIQCVAKHLYPQPNLMIEYNKFPVGQQQQRTWREGTYFEAESRATLARRALRPGAELACRLHLPQVDYTAIIKKFIHFGNQASRTSVTTSTLTYISAAAILTLFCC